MVSPVDNAPSTFVPAVHNLLRSERCLIDKSCQDSLEIAVAFFEGGIDKVSLAPRCRSPWFRLVWKRCFSEIASDCKRALIDGSRGNDTSNRNVGLS